MTPLSAADTGIVLPEGIEIHRQVVSAELVGRIGMRNAKLGGL